MGRDKFESTKISILLVVLLAYRANIYVFIDEDLIRYGFEEDIWFHVDKFSSAHVYVRLNPGMTIDTMSKELIDDCCQLVKANSIEGLLYNDAAH